MISLHFAQNSRHQICSNAISKSLMMSCQPSRPTERLRLADPGGGQSPNACFRDYRGSGECVGGNSLSSRDAASSCDGPCKHCVLCVSVVYAAFPDTTETQRTQRLHREEVKPGHYQ